MIKWHAFLFSFKTIDDETGASDCKLLVNRHSSEQRISYFKHVMSESHGAYHFIDASGVVRPMFEPTQAIGRISWTHTSDV